MSVPLGIVIVELPFPLAVTVTVVPLTDTVATFVLLEDIVPMLPAGLVKVNIVFNGIITLFLARAAMLPLLADRLGATNPVGVTVISFVTPTSFVRRTVTAFIIVFVLSFCSITILPLAAVCCVVILNHGVLLPHWGVAVTGKTQSTLISVLPLLAAVTLRLLAVMAGLITSTA